MAKSDTQRSREYRQRRREQRQAGLTSVATTRATAALVAWLAERHYGGDIAQAHSVVADLLHAHHYAPTGPSRDCKIATTTKPQSSSRERPRASPETLLQTITEIQAGGITSANGIATELNKRGVPTKSGKGVWRHRQVLELLRRQP